jgi:hypothetical protein
MKSGDFNRIQIINILLNKLEFGARPAHLGRPVCKLTLTRPSHNGSSKASGYSRITAATAAVGGPVMRHFRLGGNKTRAEKKNRQKYLNIKK